MCHGNGRWVGAWQYLNATPRTGNRGSRFSSIVINLQRWPELWRYWPIRGQYSGHVTWTDQSEASITWTVKVLLPATLGSSSRQYSPSWEVRTLLALRLPSGFQTMTSAPPWPLPSLDTRPLTNQRTVFSNSAQVISMDQSEASFQVTGSLSTNQRPV